MYNILVFSGIDYTKVHYFPGIEGQVRLRYPISPVHGEGAPVWKELNALKHLVKQQTLSSDVATMILLTVRSCLIYISRISDCQIDHHLRLVGPR